MSQEDAVSLKSQDRPGSASEQERSLKRMKLFATGLLVLMAVIYCVCRILLAAISLSRLRRCFQRGRDHRRPGRLVRRRSAFPPPAEPADPQDRSYPAQQGQDRGEPRPFLQRELPDKRPPGKENGFRGPGGPSGRLARGRAERPASLRGLRPSTPLPSFSTNGKNSLTPSPLAGPARKRTCPLPGQRDRGGEQDTSVRNAAFRFLSGLDRVGLSLYDRLLAPVGRAVSRFYDGGLRRKIGEKLVKELSNPDSELVRQAADFIKNAGQEAISDNDLRERLNKGLRAWISEAVEENKELFTVFISDTVRKWDPELPAGGSSCTSAKTYSG